MPVLDFECQLSRAQISRYMGGEILSEDLLGQLKGHVDECASCRLFLQERRDALRQMMDLSDSRPKEIEHRAGYAVIHSPASGFEAEGTKSGPSKAEALISQIKSLAPATKTETKATPAVGDKPSPKNGFSKPALYSIGLAGVLIVMSYLVKSPNGLLGPKASASFTSSQSASSDSSPTSLPAKSPTPAKAGNQAAPASAAPVAASEKTSHSLGAHPQADSIAAGVQGTQDKPAEGSKSNLPTSGSSPTIRSTASGSQSNPVKSPAVQAPVPHKTTSTRKPHSTAVASPKSRSHRVRRARALHRARKVSNPSGIRVYDSTN